MRDCCPAGNPLCHQERIQKEARNDPARRGGRGGRHQGRQERRRRPHQVPRRETDGLLRDADRNGRVLCQGTRAGIQGPRIFGAGRGRRRPGGGPQEHGGPRNTAALRDRQHQRRTPPGDNTRIDLRGGRTDGQRDGPGGGDGVDPGRKQGRTTRQGRRRQGKRPRAKATTPGTKTPAGSRVRGLWSGEHGVRDFQRHGKIL
mmetsp:Transcript_107349/g.219023  ORF Transcript_107349/g.219023 Transcript_107349/m.219023 type:complete len:202 (+) Transcript_107349:275-880(+)